MIPTLRTSAVMILVVAGLAASSEAGDHFFRRKVRTVRETATTFNSENQLAPTNMLGSFRSTPMITVGANPLIAGGFGRENSLAVYGPLSAFRAYAAPVTTVVRGYDGVLTEVEGTAFSYPNLPALSPIVYPTRANNYTALPFQHTPPQLDRGTNWIDLN
jgi:hypothetical protein